MITPPAMLTNSPKSLLYFFNDAEIKIEIKAIIAILTIIFTPKN